MASFGAASIFQAISRVTSPRGCWGCRRPSGLFQHKCRRCLRPSLSWPGTSSTVSVLSCRVGWPRRRFWFCCPCCLPPVLTCTELPPKTRAASWLAATQLQGRWVAGLFAAGEPSQTPEVRPVVCDSVIWWPWSEFANLSVEGAVSAISLTQQGWA